MATHEKESVKKTHIVGIGASAGGLEALSQFLSALPPGLNCTYIIAQHMSPNHRSMMADILSRETSIPIHEVTDGEPLQADAIYLIPPGFNLTLHDGAFRLSATSPEVSPKPSINLLFQSIAEEYDELAVGIVLSGTGSDGTRGLRAIKSAGGITFVQSPETAKYDGMPRSAIEACVADRILEPGQIGHEFERLLNFSGELIEHDAGGHRPEELTELYELVRLHTKIDFSSYKIATVQRRLQRRMVATESRTLAEYLTKVKLDSNELDALAKETLISVTEFFRDKDAFRALDRYASEIITNKKDGEEVRVWVVGCATGEEAYTLAILMSEAMLHAGKRLSLKVFATDIDQDALNVARRGIYNQAAIAEIPPEYKDKYFIASGNGFEPIKPLRDYVTFARQDITTDPPFMRLDLVTCRNVLIYFNSELQAKVLAVLRYALRNDGFLLLGRSETVSHQESLFAPVDRRSRIFKPRGQNKPMPISRLVKGKLNNEQAGSLLAQVKIFERLFFNAVADHFGPAMLIDANFKILHSHGDVSRFIRIQSGTPEMNLAQLIVPELANDILTTTHRAHKGHCSAYGRKRRIASANHETWRLAVHPITSQTEGNVFLIEFQAASRPEKVATESSATAHDNESDLNDELASTREHLQTLTEEMAASNEEMQALNEEVQAANEELQASNEELEAANEELQATNEELLSVNEESLTKSAELAAINSDFESVYNTIEFPILVFDPDLYLKRTNGVAMKNYDLPAFSTGQHIGRLKLPKFLMDFQEAMATAVTEQRKHHATTVVEGKTYQIFITPALSTTGVTQSLVLVVVDNTELVAAQERIRQTQERLLAIMNHSVSVVSLKDIAGRYEFINQRFAELFRVHPDKITGKTDMQLFGEQIATALRSKDLETMAQLDAIESLDEVELPSGKVWLQAVRFPIFDDDGTIRAICTQATDVSDKQHAEEQLRLAAKVFDRSGEAIMVTDAQGSILTVNEAFIKITGYALKELIGQNPRLLSSGTHSKDFYTLLWQDLKENGAWQGEIINKRKNGELYPEWLTINAVLDDHGNAMNYVAIFSDISAIKSSQRRIEFMATHDELTGIPNRSLLMDRLKHCLSLAKRQNQSLAVLFIDLDNFKNINDSLGHDVGDLLLKAVTTRLKSCIRDADTLARLGGDEFVVLLINVNLEEVNAIAGRMVDFLTASFNINDKALFASASIGISIFPDDGDDSVTLLKNADTAMYRAKERGRNQYQFFADEMKVLALQRMTLETGLRIAIDAGYFKVVYQPKVDVHSGRIIGAEALLRWPDPQLGDVSPAKFIPVAESSGLISSIGQLVFEKVLHQIAQWQKNGMEVPPIAINVSAHQLKSDSFVDSIVLWLDEAGVAPSQIGIEITESTLLEGVETVARRLDQIDRMGIGISIDDFGTGYSSLSYLKKLPLHELKVDRSFVDGIDLEPDDRAIATAIIDMAHALGLQVVAEGVETANQMAVLKTLHCDIVQGFMFYRPLPAEQFAQALLTQSTTRQ